MNTVADPLKALFNEALVTAVGNPGAVRADGYGALMLDLPAGELKITSLASYLNNVRIDWASPYFQAWSKHQELYRCFQQAYLAQQLVEKSCPVQPRTSEPVKEPQTQVILRPEVNARTTRTTRLRTWICHLFYRFFR
jgi:hypothetical protein